jgi:hypothetical protein
MPTDGAWSLPEENPLTDGSGRTRTVNRYHLKT